MIVDCSIQSGQSLQNLTFAFRGAGSGRYTPTMLRLCGQYLGIVVQKACLDCATLDFVQFNMNDAVLE